MIDLVCRCYISTIPVYFESFQCVSHYCTTHCTHLCVCYSFILIYSYCHIRIPIYYVKSHYIMLKHMIIYLYLAYYNLFISYPIVIVWTIDDHVWYYAILYAIYYLYHSCICLTTLFTCKVLYYVNLHYYTYKYSNLM